MSRAVILAAIALAFLVAGCGAATHSQPANSTTAGSPVTGQLTDLHSIEQLSSAFNAATGQPRLVVLMSPT